jgi:hypothetical protein
MVLLSLAAATLCGILLSRVIPANSPIVEISRSRNSTESATVQVPSRDTLGNVAGRLLDAVATEAIERGVCISDVEVIQDGYEVGLEQGGESVGRAQVQMMWTAIDVSLHGLSGRAWECGFLNAALGRAAEE